jgi:hypothetical protein
VNIKRVKDDEGKERLLFDCAHQGRLPIVKTGSMCDPYRADGKTYMCGRALENKRPKLRPDDGCPGGYMVCTNCADTECVE